MNLTKKVAAIAVILGATALTFSLIPQGFTYSSKQEARAALKSVEKLVPGYNYFKLENSYLYQNGTRTWENVALDKGQRILAVCDQNCQGIQLSLKSNEDGSVIEGQSTIIAGKAVVALPPVPKTGEYTLKVKMDSCTTDGSCGYAFGIYTPDDPTASSSTSVPDDDTTNGTPRVSERCEALIAALVRCVREEDCPPTTLTPPTEPTEPTEPPTQRPPTQPPTTQRPPTCVEKCQQNCEVECTTSDSTRPSEAVPTERPRRSTDAPTSIERENFIWNSDDEDEDITSRLTAYQTQLKTTQGNRYEQSRRVASH